MCGFTTYFKLVNKSLAIITAPCHLISAGGEFDFPLVGLPAHDRELGQLSFLQHGHR